EPLASGAHRRAHGELTAAAESAGEEEVREVGARDEQHAPGRARERDEEQSRPLRHLVAKRDHAGADVLVLFRILLSRLRSDQLQLRARLTDRHARPEPTDRLEPVVVSILVVLLVEPLRPPPQGIRGRKTELSRHDADDRVRLAVERDGSPDDVLASEFGLPEAIAEEERSR